MKAIIKKKRAPGLWLEDLPVPSVKEGEVLIKIRKTSICGTDLHIYNWDDWAQQTVPVPLVIGHEFMGEIVELGQGVRDLNIGDRVTGEGHLTCGKCPFCLTGRRHLCLHTRGIGYHCPGAFAEYFSFPAENVFVLPPDISDDLAAIMDPFGNSVHTALAFDLVGQDVLISGAGPTGLMAAAIARHSGAHQVVITDLNPYRLELAIQLGATRAIDLRKESVQTVMQQLGLPHGFTVGLEMSGNPSALTTQIESLQPGGKLALLGLFSEKAEIDWNRLIFKMLTIKGIYGRRIFSTWFTMKALLESGLNLASVITHSYPAEEFEKGFAAMMSGQTGKVILDWQALSIKNHHEAARHHGKSRENRR
jgi:threonine 3-dehydrogenase